MNASGAFPLVALTGSNGFSGTIHGQLVTPASGHASGRGGAGAVFVFELRNAQGEVIFGAVAAEADI